MGFRLSSVKLPFVFFLLILLTAMTVVPVLVFQFVVGSQAKTTVQNQLTQVTRSILELSQENLSTSISLTQKFLDVLPSLEGVAACLSNTDKDISLNIEPTYAWLLDSFDVLLFVEPEKQAAKHTDSHSDAHILTRQEGTTKYTGRLVEFFPDKGKQSLRLLSQLGNQTAIVGNLAFVDFDPGYLWIVRNITLEGQKVLVAAAMGPKRIDALIRKMQEATASVIYVITQDNIVFGPQAPGFFVSSYAARALSRVRSGEYSSFEADKELIVHVYSNLAYLYNIVATTASDSYTKPALASIQYSTGIVLLFAFLLIIFAIVISLRLARRFNYLNLILEDIAKGKFEHKDIKPYFSISELELLHSQILSMSSTLEATLSSLAKSRLDLEEINKGLETKVAERTRALEESMQSLVETQDFLLTHEKMAAVGRLVVGFTHELNNPLGLTLTSLGALSQNLSGVLTAYKENKLGASQFEQGLVDSLELSTLSEKNLKQAITISANLHAVATSQVLDEEEKFDLGDCLRDIFASLKPRFASKSFILDLQVESGIEITSHQSRFYQIVSNLVLNSINHAFEGRSSGLMRLEMHSSPSKPGYIDMIYTDNGIGMDETILSQISKPFFTTKKGRGGTGLGMNIVRQIVEERLSGSLTITSKPGEGSCFHIQFARPQPQ